MKKEYECPKVDCEECKMEDICKASDGDFNMPIDPHEW